MSTPRPKSLQPRHRAYTSFDDVKDDVHALFNGMQQKNIQILGAAPNANQIDEGQIILMDDGTNRRIYTKINNTIRYVALT